MSAIKGLVLNIKFAVCHKVAHTWVPEKEGLKAQRYEGSLIRHYFSEAHLVHHPVCTGTQ
eukprot:1157921-Pelagomonas_calceolata.AAC.4